MRAKFFLLVAVATSFLLGNSAWAARNMTLEFHEPETRPKTLLVVPVQAQLQISRVGQNEPVVAESAQWESKSLEDLIAGLEAKGYSVSVVDGENQEPEVQRLVTEVNSDYDDASTQMARKPKEILKRRYNIGSSARELAQKHGADALVIPRVSASAQAGGALVMSALVGGGTPNMAVMSLTVVDAGTGDVEAYFVGVGGGLNVDKLKAADDTVIQKMVDKSLKKYPQSDKTLKLGKKARARAVARSVPEAEEEAVIDDLEDLIGSSGE